MKKAAAEKPWFGIEQEYTLFKAGEKVPLGFPDDGVPTRPQGTSLCNSAVILKKDRTYFESRDLKLSF